MNRSKGFPLAAVSMAMLPLLFLTFPGRASAACGADADILAFPQIGVIGDGVAYTEAESNLYMWTGRIRVECGVFGRVASWGLWPVVEVEGMGVLSFFWHRASTDYSFPRPKTVDESPSVHFSSSYVSTYAVNACNLHAQHLRQDGMTNPVIFSKDRVIALEYRPSWSVQVRNTYSLIQEASSVKFSEIICRKREVGEIVKPTDLTAEVELELLMASLVLFPSNFEGACPKDMSLFARVDSSMTGSIEVWIESTAGWKSDVGLLETSEFSQAGGSWFGELDEKLAVPILLPAPPHSGQVVPPSPTGDLILPPIAPGGNGPPSVPDWTPGFSVEGPAGNLHTASLRLVARFGEQTINSDWQNYRYTCDPKSAIDPAAQDLVAPDGTPPEGVTRDYLTEE
jgi:hypothetical protein